MQDIEPYYNWRHLYTAEVDEKSPFFGRVYSEFEYTQTLYNFYIHPQWDSFGSQTLFMKVLYCHYENGFAIIELIGEWNDLLYNDIMFLKREVIELMMQEGVTKFILIGENILNFHFSDDSYYEEWFEEVEDGWIAAINFREHVIDEFKRNNIDYYLNFGGELDQISWRSLKPNQLFKNIEALLTKRLQ